MSALYALGARRNATKRHETTLFLDCAMPKALATMLSASLAMRTARPHVLLELQIHVVRHDDVLHIIDTLDKLKQAAITHHALDLVLEAGAI